MESIIGTILALVIVLGILVFVHEFGHFITAKLVGIKVDVFSLGYGKRLFGFKTEKTDYRISLIPMGGYVKFAGEQALEGMSGTDHHRHGDFMAAKRWQRFLVIVSGPVMNIALAIVFLAIVNMIGTKIPSYWQQSPTIGWIESNSPAA